MAGIGHVIANFSGCHSLLFELFLEPAEQRIESDTGPQGEIVFMAASPPEMIGLRDTKVADRSQLAPEKDKSTAIQLAETDPKNPSSPILTIEGVASLLGCSVQWVRGIPASELPRHRVAKRDLYIPDEIVSYVRSRRRASPGADHLILEAEREVLGSAPDSERGRPSRRARNA
jgi:hypothetical protein